MHACVCVCAVTVVPHSAGTGVNKFDTCLQPCSLCDVHPRCMRTLLTAAADDDNDAVRVVALFL